MHVDDFIDNIGPLHSPGERYAAFCLLFYRLPVSMKLAFGGYLKDFRLFCEYRGEQYRVTGASRMGDVWLARDFDRQEGYDLRVDIADCSGWTGEPNMLGQEGV